MRKIESKEITEVREVNIVKEVICNKCGKSTELQGTEFEQELQVAEYQSIRCCFGYGSSYDGEYWRFEICEDCLTDFIRTFKYVPDGFGQFDCIAAHPQAMFEKWKETGIVDLEAGMTPEEIEENGGIIYVDRDDD